MKVVIVKYDAGNIYSVVHALRRIGVEPLLTDNEEDIRSADRIVFPGQGEAATTMNSLKSSGLDRLIPSLKQPVLGICIGMQLMCSHSEEGDTDCLGIFEGSVVKRFVPQTKEDKIPHIGWNTANMAGNPLFKGISNNDFFYFIHSFYASVHDAYTIARTDYCGTAYSAAMNKDNFFATQFHPEKSGKNGETLLRNFLELDF